MTFDEIKQLLEVVREHELAEFELEREGFKIDRDKSDATADYLAMHRSGCHVSLSSMVLPPEAASRVTEKSEPENGYLMFVQGGRIYSFYVTWVAADPEPWCKVATLRPLLSP